MRLIDHFRRGARVDPQRPAFLSADGAIRVSYAEVERFAEEVAAGLHTAGCADANVAVFSPNDPEAFCAIIAVFRAGERWVPINMRCPPEDCGGVRGHERLRRVISDPTHEEHDELVEWLGGEFDPEAFDAAAVTRELQA